MVAKVIIRYASIVISDKLCIVQVTQWLQKYLKKS